MDNKVLNVLIQRLEEAAVYQYVHNNEAWKTQLEYDRKALISYFEKKIELSYPLVSKWKEQMERQSNCESDFEICPLCNEQLYFCSCVEQIAQEIMEISFGYKEGAE